MLLEERESFLGAAVVNNQAASYEFGQTDLLSVLQMQARTINSKIFLIRIKNARLAQRIDLHLALGGKF